MAKSVGIKAKTQVSKTRVIIAAGLFRRLWWKEHLIRTDWINVTSLERRLITWAAEFACWPVTSTKSPSCLSKAQSRNKEFPPWNTRRHHFFRTASFVGLFFFTKILILPEKVTNSFDFGTKQQLKEGWKCELKIRVKNYRILFFAYALFINRLQFCA